MRCVQVKWRLLREATHGIEEKDYLENETHKENMFKTYLLVILETYPKFNRIITNMQVFHQPELVLIN